MATTKHMIYDSSNGETHPQYLGLTSKAADSERLDGKVYESKIDANVYSPTAYSAGWTLIP